MSINTANVTTTGGNIYTSSGNTVVTWLSLCNTTAGNITANVHVLASGASANSMNTIISNVLITIGDTYQIYTGNEKLLLDTQSEERLLTLITGCVHIPLLSK